MNEASSLKSPRTSTRIMTAMALLVLWLFIVFQVPIAPYFQLVVIGMVTLGAWEWMGFINGKLIWRAIYAAVVALLMITLLDAFPYAVWLVPTAILWVASPLRLLQFAPNTRPNALVVLASGVALLSGFGCALIALREVGAWVLLAPMAMVALNDTAAWLAGKRWGKALLAPYISPNKTWEGFYAGVFAVVMASVGVAWALALPMIKTAALAAIIAMIATAGDLFISCYKREAAIKDTGRVFPGHGGLLDRVDGHLAALPVFWVLHAFIF